MGKFVIKCPECNNFVEAKTGLFKSNKLICSCGNIISLKRDKLISRECPHCGNNVVVDQTEGKHAKCPVCHKKINRENEMNVITEIICEECGVTIQANKDNGIQVCPVCDHKNDITKLIEKQKLSKKGFASVIQYEANADSIIWKHPIENFNFGTQLIVHENQEALFYKDGEALDLFGAGRYTLETEQLPIMERFFKLPTDSDKTFHSEVYFINKQQQMAYKWGTAEKVTLIDPTSNAPIMIGARGMFNFKVSDARRMLVKLVGNASGLTRDDLFGINSNSHIKDYFRGIVQVGVPTKLAEIITEEKIDILQIDLYKLKLSEKLKEALIPYFDEYGMEITEFLVEGIILPQKGEIGYETVQTLIKLRQTSLTKQVISTEADIKLAEMEAKKTLDIKQHENEAEIEMARRKQVIARGETDVYEAELAGKKKIISTQADVEAEKLQLEVEMSRKAQTAQIEAQEMAAKGYTQKDVIQGEVMKSFAENQTGGLGMGTGMGNMASEAMGMGMNFATMGAAMGMATNMMGVGAQMGKEMTTAISGAMNNTVNVPNSDSWNCVCGAKNITSKFCPECGSSKPVPVTAWNCECGTTGISSKYCPNCGSKKLEVLGNVGWNCSCGKTGIISKFCPECGSPKNE